MERATSEVCFGFFFLKVQNKLNNFSFFPPKHIKIITPISHNIKALTDKVSGIDGGYRTMLQWKLWFMWMFLDP